jgi:hypothetical protein
VFTLDDRDRVRERVARLAATDDRITGAAITGSAALGNEDRYSDVDLAFGVRSGAEIPRLLDDWTAHLSDELDVVHHWDLVRGPTRYRVFLIGEGLELDVSATPHPHFGPHGPSFRLISGEASEVSSDELPRLAELIGWGWVYALSARAAILRKRSWQAAHFISELRNEVLELACLRLGLPPFDGRGVDRLPADLLTSFQPTLVRSTGQAELRRALGASISVYLREVAEHDEPLAGRLSAPLSFGWERESR